MNDPITPALTPEEWTGILEPPAYLFGNPDTAAQERQHYIDCSLADALRRAAAYGDDHKAAALALHGQPFGFTREDVTVLNEITVGTEDDTSEYPNALVYHCEFSHNDMVRLRSLAARLAALLPEAP